MFCFLDTYKEKRYTVLITGEKRIRMDEAGKPSADRRRAQRKVPWRRASRGKNAEAFLKMI